VNINRTKSIKPTNQNSNAVGKVSNSKAYQYFACVGDDLCNDLIHDHERLMNDQSNALLLFYNLFGFLTHCEILFTSCEALFLSFLWGLCVPYVNLCGFNVDFFNDIDC
jgi:hypothetical protein